MANWNMISTVDQLFLSDSIRTAAIGAHALPEEGVVPGLRGVVELGAWAAVVPCRHDNLRGVQASVRLYPNVGKHSSSGIEPSRPPRACCPDPCQRSACSGCRHRPAQLLLASVNF